jgi:lipoate synthase
MGQAMDGMPLDSLVQLQPPSPRLPEWLRGAHTHFESVHHLKTELRRLRLHTVCESGHFHDPRQPVYARLRILRRS